MSSYKDQLSAVLKQHSYSLTKPRLLVFETLYNQDPLTMNQIVASCIDKIDRASIYRTITLFEQIGIIHRLQLGWKHKFELSDDFHAHHHHFTCVICGGITTLHEDADLEKRLEHLANAQNFKMQGHQIEIQGVCKDCNKKTRE
jgi:Fur family ferric uptake transcriptional regulator